MSQKKVVPIRNLLLSSVFAILIVSASLMALYFVDQGKYSQLIRVACVGDSITKDTNYPADLQNVLGSGYKVESFGVVGTTALLNTDRPYLNQTAFQEVKTFLPNIIFVMLGTNDARINIYQHSENFETDYKLLINDFQNLKSEPKIWILLPPPIFNNTLGLISSNLLNGVIPRTQSVANELNVQTIDIYTALYSHPEYFLDGVHPNAEGAKLIAEEVFKAITTSHQ